MKVFAESGLAGKAQIWKAQDISDYGGIHFVLDATQPRDGDEPEHIVMTVMNSPGGRWNLHGDVAGEETGRIMHLEPVRSTNPEDGKVLAENLVAWWKAKLPAV